MELTDEGMRFAKMTETNREVLSQFFTNILGLPPEMANEDACMIEHLVSPESMVQFLRLTALIQSDDPAAERFRAAFKSYQEKCDAGSAGADCPVCQGECVKDRLDEFEAAPPAKEPGRRGRR